MEVTASFLQVAQCTVRCAFRDDKGRMPIKKRMLHWLGLPLKAFGVSTDVIVHAFYALLVHAVTDVYNHAFSADDLDDDQAGIMAATTFASAREEYDMLLQDMLQMWLGFLGIAIVMWVALRIEFRGKLSHWGVVLAEQEEEWSRDLWAPTQKNELINRRRLVSLMREGCALVSSRKASHHFNLFTVEKAIFFRGVRYIR